MRFNSPERPRIDENLVPLIDIAFLILIFFLIASTIKPFSDREIRLAEIEAPLSAAASPRLLIIRADGTRYAGSRLLSEEELEQRLKNWSQESDAPITIVADRKLKASQLIDMVARASAAGIKDVKLLTRRVR